jgi:hypothetical protein
MMSRPWNGETRDASRGRGVHPFLHDHPKDPSGPSVISCLAEPSPEDNGHSAERRIDESFCPLDADKVLFDECRAYQFNDLLRLRQAKVVQAGKPAKSTGCAVQGRCKEADSR